MERTQTATKRWLALMLLGALAGAPTPAVAGRDAGEAAYLEVREQVAAFREDAKRRKFRHHYERLISRMRRVAAEHPRSDRADDALYVAAQLYDELYDASRVGADLQAAVGAYEEMATKHPASNLADDALFRAATLRLERLADREGARKALQRIAALDGPADFKPRARELLARLPPEPESAAVATNKREGVQQMIERVADELSSDEDASAKRSPAAQVEVLPDPPPKGTKARHLKKLRHRKRDGVSVVRVRLAGPVGVEKGEVPKTAEKPRRIFFDLTPVKVVGNVKPVTPKNGVIRRVRVGQYDDDTARVVVELEGDEEPDLHIEGKPFELQLRVGDKPKTPPKVAAAPAVDATEAPAPDAEAVRERLGDDGAPGGVSISQQMGLKVRRIVLDPGHGGHDSGALGRGGLKEKDINLKIAEAIKARLHREMPGVEVVMTRTDDTFIELADRTRIANEANADLFISIHANANPSRKVSGVETYYLNITHDRYAIRLAARENSHSGEGASISDLEFILADLAMKSNVDDSIRLGRHVQGSVVSRLRQDYKKVNDLGLKHALFFVLLGSKMPAILVETSFLSNRMEEKRLGTRAYRDAIAEGVVRGVRRFVEERQAFNTR